MDWMHLFTSIEGRISRQPFWIALLCLSVPELVAHFALGERWSSIVSLLIAYPEFAVFAKRGHDRNVPTWVAGVFIAGAVVLDLMTLLDLSGPMTNPTHAVLRRRRSSRHHGPHPAGRFRIPPRHRRPEPLRSRSARIATADPITGAHFAIETGADRKN